MERIEALEDAIQKKSLVGIYSVFYTIVHGDPTFTTGKFSETLNYVKSKNIEGFIQEFDGEEFEPEDKWDEEYWAMIASSLIDNFCDIRIQHLEQVGKKVFPEKANTVPKQGSNTELKGRSSAKQKAPQNVPPQKKARISEEKKQNVRMTHRMRSEKRDNGSFLDFLRGKRR